MPHVWTDSFHGQMNRVSSDGRPLTEDGFASVESVFGLQSDDLDPGPISAERLRLAASLKARSCQGRAPSQCYCIYTDRLSRGRIH
jgi:hypothetical protein